jgi:hypothetical protein
MEKNGGKAVPLRLQFAGNVEATALGDDILVELHGTHFLYC